MSFKFIDENYTGFTAADADELEDFSISGIFIGQEKRGAFRIGNTGSQTTGYSISASGLNTDILDGVNFSTDGTTFSPTIGTSGVQPNQVSDLVRFSFQLTQGDPIGPGTFLIRVDEEAES